MPVILTKKYSAVYFSGGARKRNNYKELKKGFLLTFLFLFLTCKKLITFGKSKTSLTEEMNYVSNKIIKNIFFSIFILYLVSKSYRVFDERVYEKLWT